MFYTFPTLHYTTLYYTHIGPAAGFVCVRAYAMCICVWHKVTVNINTFSTQIGINQGGINTINEPQSGVAINGVKGAFNS